MSPRSTFYKFLNRAKKNADLEQELLTKGRTKLNLELTGYEDLAAACMIFSIALAIYTVRRMTKKK